MGDDNCRSVFGGIELMIISRQWETRKHGKRGMGNGENRTQITFYLLVASGEFD